MGVALLALATSCGLHGSTSAPEAEAHVETSPALTAAAASAAEVQHADTRPWSEIESDVYETLVGSGLRFERFVSGWGGFGEDGLHRPDDSVLVMELAGRALSSAESRALEARYDKHAETIRDTAALAFSALREVLDAKWSANLYDRTVSTADDNVAAEATRAYDRESANGGYTYCDMFTTGGWQIRMLVCCLEHPDFHAAFLEMRRAVHARKRDARSYLESLG